MLPCCIDLECVNSQVYPVVMMQFSQCVEYFTQMWLSTKVKTPVWRGAIQYSVIQQGD